MIMDRSEDTNNLGLPCAAGCATFVHVKFEI